MSSLWFPSSSPKARRSHPCPRQTCAQLNQLEEPPLHFAEGPRTYSLVTVIALAAMMAGFVPATAQSPPSPGQAQTQVEAASRLVTEGSSALQQDDLNAARNLFQRALDINPKDVLAHTYLGFLADRTGDLKEAELHFAAATEIAPALASARNNYGGILLKRGRVKEAEAQFEASLRLDLQSTERIGQPGPDSLFQWQSRRPARGSCFVRASLRGCPGLGNCQGPGGERFTS